MLAIQTGCTSANAEVILEPVCEAAALESSLEISAGNLDKSDGSFPGEESEGADSALESASVNTQVVVYVCGAVKEPGVYELKAGSRLDDAVRSAGGFDDEADRTYVNLAAVCEDGIKLYIPTLQEVSEKAALDGSPALAEGNGLMGVSAGSGIGPAAAESGLININTATKEELTSLPGIGGGYADRIIAYRNEKGAFKSIEDIMKVSGIKDKLFSRIKDKITV